MRSVRPMFQESHLGPWFAQDQEIADTTTYDMGNIFTDRAQVGSDSQGEFFGRKRRKSLDQESLMGIPPVVERQEIDLLFGHQKDPFLSTYAGEDVDGELITSQLVFREIHWSNRAR